MTASFSISDGHMHRDRTWRGNVKGIWPTDCGLPMLQSTTSGKGRSSPFFKALMCSCALMTIWPRTAYSMFLILGLILSGESAAYGVAEKARILDMHRAPAPRERIMAMAALHGRIFLPLRAA